MRGIRARGNSIALSFTYRGVFCRETLKLEPTPANLKFASNKRQSILFQIAVGNFDYDKHFPNSRTKSAKKFKSGRSSSKTISALLNEYLINERRRLQPSTEKGYLSAIRHHLIPTFGDLKLTELNISELESWFSQLDISNKRINNILIPLKAIYRKAYELGEIDTNPLKHLKNLPVVLKEPNPLTPSEIRSLLNVLEGQVKNYVQFAIWTGLRTSELIALKWSDIDQRKNMARINRAKVLGKEKQPKTKAGKRTIKLLSAAISAINKQEKLTKQISDYVFHDPRRNEPWKNDQAIRKVFWYPALKRAGIKKRCIYETRHTFASLAISAGENILWVSRQMGHDQVSTTLRTYARYIDEVDASSGLKLENLFDTY